MADERDQTYNKQFQQDRKDAHMADASKNKEAWEQKAQDAAGRDWTKPRRWDPSQGVQVEPRLLAEGGSTLKGRAPNAFFILSEE